ncbi:hypothetical protein KKB28_00010, partial [bacterium]|nr:hypothetical protein [bacterium]
MYSRKIISFPLVAIAAVALIFGAGQVSAQLQNQSHLDEFEASCQTTWDGNSWESCESAHVAAETAFTATFCVSAPSCDYNCRQGDPHAPDSRSADLK